MYFATTLGATAATAALDASSKASLSPLAALAPSPTHLVRASLHVSSLRTAVSSSSSLTLSSSPLTRFSICSLLYLPVRIMFWITSFLSDATASSSSSNRAFCRENSSCICAFLRASLAAARLFSIAKSSAAIEKITPSPRMSAPCATASASPSGLMVRAVCPISCTCSDTSILCHHWAKEAHRSRKLGCPTARFFMAFATGLLRVRMKRVPNLKRGIIPCPSCLPRNQALDSHDPSPRRPLDRRWRKGRSPLQRAATAAAWVSCKRGSTKSPPALSSSPSFTRPFQLLPTDQG
mmetsp:Transcript_19143/g.48342  ORF Transcript_19143/g.48342 Transcript_19143/m.48342 type:complete len:294 (-) Transcript_19143:80-961(-)